MGLSPMNTASSVFEIVELPSGEIVLRRSDEGDEPLVSIRFSSDARVALGEAITDIGKAMIGTGVGMVGQIFEDEDAELEQQRVVH